MINRQLAAKTVQLSMSHKEPYPQKRRLQGRLQAVSVFILKRVGYDSWPAKLEHLWE